eukprot:jgi/Ulvmu1/12039/UM083_0052.1
MSGSSQYLAMSEHYASRRSTLPYASGKENAHRLSNRSPVSYSSYHRYDGLHGAKIPIRQQADTAGNSDGVDISVKSWKGGSSSAEHGRTSMCSGRMDRTKCRSVQTSFTVPQPSACLNIGHESANVHHSSRHPHSDDECVTGSPARGGTGATAPFDHHRISTSPASIVQDGHAAKAVLDMVPCNEASLQHLAHYVRPAMGSANLRNEGKASEFRLSCNATRTLRDFDAPGTLMPATGGMASQGCHDRHPVQHRYLQDTPPQPESIVLATRLLRFAYGDSARMKANSGDSSSLICAAASRSFVSPKRSQVDECNSTAVFPSHMLRPGLVGSSHRGEGMQVQLTGRHVAGDHSLAGRLGRPPLQALPNASKPSLQVNLKRTSQTSDAKDAISSAVLKADKVLASLRSYRARNCNASTCEDASLATLATSPTACPIPGQRERLPDTAARERSMPRPVLFSGMAAPTAASNLPGDKECFPSSIGYSSRSELHGGALRSPSRPRPMQIGLSPVRGASAPIIASPVPPATVKAPWAESLRRKLQEVRTHSNSASRRSGAPRRLQEGYAGAMLQQPLATSRVLPRAHVPTSRRQPNQDGIASLPPDPRHGRPGWSRPDSSTPAAHMAGARTVWPASQPSTSPGQAKIHSRPRSVGACTGHAQATRAVSWSSPLADASRGRLRTAHSALPHEMSRPKVAVASLPGAVVPAWGSSHQQSPCGASVRLRAQSDGDRALSSGARGRSARPLLDLVSHRREYAPGGVRGLSWPCTPPSNSTRAAARTPARGAAPVAVMEGLGGATAVRQEVRGADAAWLPFRAQHLGASEQLSAGTKLVERLRAAQWRSIADSDTGHQGRTMAKGGCRDLTHASHPHATIVGGVKPQARPHIGFTGSAGLNACTPRLANPRNTTVSESPRSPQRVRRLPRA